ncbi:hypothetical protein AS9A_2570 [Hoyosella subflava DQS3-9A1]|uniref:Uncharacterized protein n=1 Tax=Hoyosella subflava (strain DSM 45089 / JCM 17490 / NBRC 109087 / DQS3-9A1) TaxID=443218 RepID=F6EGG4_HOYSD|nr:hypothetical protein AS9A_2570 [Hoyosella subflava DQS3-9A1]
MGVVGLALPMRMVVMRVVIVGVLLRKRFLELPLLLVRNLMMLAHE